ncbi:MAG TPA: YafY family protein [Rhodanobacteraceae bacterium]|nr:YafY family protein [Rhodanobacteraceae bacterium]
MDRYERILTLHRKLKNARYPVPLAQLLDDLACSRATLYRDIAFLRDALGAPVESAGGDEAAFSYADDEGERFELPGLWLTSEELAAILALNELIGRSDPGVLTGALAPFKSRIQHLLADRVSGESPPIERIRVIPYGARKLDQHTFRIVAGAVLERRRLTFHYRARTTGDDSRRDVSPQRLTHYRDNWYLDAWDHHRDALRSFAVDRITDAHVGNERARDMENEELDAVLASSYGIFAGKPRAWATVRFSSHAARWVADEHWHSEQQGSWLADGRYELRLPYSNSSELLRDILKYGADAEVVAPTELREKMKIQLQLAQGMYQDKS